MPYTYFQYIAYEVPTLGYDLVAQKFIAAFPPGDLCDAIQTIPISNKLELSDDALKRLRRLAAVVDTARNQVVAQGNGNNDILKIFMAPEFYFRPNSGDSNSYEHEQIGRIQAALGLMFKHANFNDWLIIPGSTIYNITIPALAFYNTAYCIWGGEAHSRVYAIEKRQPSNIDGVPVDGGVTNPDVADGHYANYYQEWSTRKQRIFNIDGRYIGLDICLDHFEPFASRQHSTAPWRVDDSCRVVKRLLAEWLTQPPFPAFLPPIDLHLLTAGGMPINPISVAGRVGGYILRNDGHPFLQNNPHSELQQIIGYTGNPPEPSNIDTGPAVYSGVDPDTHEEIGEFPYASEATLQNIAPENPPTPLDGAMQIYIDDPDWVDNMQQQLVFYPVQGMPH